MGGEIVTETAAGVETAIPAGETGMTETAGAAETEVGIAGARGTTGMTATKETTPGTQEDNGGLPELQQGAEVEYVDAGGSHISAGEYQRQWEAHQQHPSDNPRPKAYTYPASRATSQEYDYDPASSFRSHRRDARQAVYANHLEDGLDGSTENSAQDRGGRNRSSSYRSGSRYGSRQQSTSTLYVRGIPEDQDESDLHQLLGKWPGVVAIRISRDRLTGQPRGYAFVEFESVEAAEAVMDSDGRTYIDLPDGGVLSLEYSHTALAGTSQPVNSLDWLCNRCQATNFARRLECHQCSTARAPDAQRVNTEVDMPTDVLKVSNIEPQTTEEALLNHVSRHALAKEVRLIMDKLRGAPRGFGFMHFHSVADASKVLHALQDSSITGQAKRLRFCFARDRNADKVQSSHAAANALEAAQAMSAAYSTWAPREFDEAALNGSGSQPGNDAQANGTSSGAPAQHGKSQMDQAKQSTKPAADSGFQYDSTSGYYFHAASGFYYDANSGLYYDSSEQVWKQHNPESGLYMAVQSEIQQPGNAGSSAQAPLGETSADIHSMAHLHAPEIEYKPPPEAKKRGATIGSAPKLNPEGILAAAREAQAREDEQRRAKAAASAKAAKKIKQKRHQGRQQSAVASHQVAAPLPPGQQADVPAGSQVAAPANGGAVKGVIRSSGKWGGPRNTGIS